MCRFNLLKTETFDILGQVFHCSAVRYQGLLWDSSRAIRLSIIPFFITGSMLSIFQVFLGLVAGNVLQYHKDSYPRMIRWLVWCVICGVIGTILCFAGDVDAPIPVNKNLWWVGLGRILIKGIAAVAMSEKGVIWNGVYLFPQQPACSIYIYFVDCSIQ